MDKLAPISRVQHCESNMWTEYGEIVKKFNPVNLGTYLPDETPQKFLIDTFTEVIQSQDSSIHQYSKSEAGHPRLANILAKLYSKLIERNIDPTTEVLTTLGASEGLSCVIFSLITDGDEVIVIEPFFENFITLIEMAGGVPKYVALRNKEESNRTQLSSDWIFNVEELKMAFSSKTKLIIVNTPNNPLGKVYDLSELTVIADLCKKWNVICLADEVYEWMVYEPNQHIRMASLPGMWEKTITLGSAGKTFSLTGWKVGWLYGPQSLIKRCQAFHQATVFTGSTPLEETIARVLEQEYLLLGKKNSFFKHFQSDLKSKRDRAMEILIEAKFKPVIPDGGAFIIADWSELESRIDMSAENDQNQDFRFTKALAKGIGVLGIPISKFFTNKNRETAEKFMRICLIKNRKNLEDAARALEKLK